MATPEAALASTPLRFEANQGQTDPQVKFVSRGSKEPLFLTATESVLAVPGQGGGVRMRLQGAKADPEVRGEDRLPGITNYFFGRDPDGWVTGVRSYSKVRYVGAYRGIDVVYYGDEQGRLEYDFVVAPGADPGQIAMAFAGHDGLTLDGAGDLVLRTKEGAVRQAAPVIFQDVDGARRPVPGSYVVNGETVGFDIGPHDRDRPLVIDPVITYSTYLGGSGQDAALGVAVDAAGNSYVTGSTTSIDFPLSAGGAPEGGKTCGADGDCDAYSTPSSDPTKPTPFNPQPDVFITKLSPDGALLYSTYLGHGGDDRGLSIAVDPQGQAYVAGRTNSPGFPTSANAFDKTCGTDGTCNYRQKDSDPNKGENRPDGFLAKLSADGSTLLYSTFVGGSGDDTGRAGRIYYYVSPTSTDPTDPEPGDEVEAVGQQGGIRNGLHPGPAAAVAVGPGGIAYITGVTLSTDLLPKDIATSAVPFDDTCGTDGKCDKTRDNQYFLYPQDDVLLYQTDSFLFKVDTTATEAEPRKSLLYATYLGGSQSDVGRDIEVAMDGGSPSPSEVLITGLASSDFPESGGAGGGFLVRFDTAAPSTGAVRYSKSFGNEVEMFSLAAGATGTAYLAGHTRSNEFPTTAPGEASPLQPEKSVNPNRHPNMTAGTTDAVVVKLDTSLASDAPPIYATYLGGWNNDSGRGIAVDPSGRASVTGYTASLNFPVEDPVQLPLERDELTEDCKMFTDDSGRGPGSSDCRDAFLAVLEDDGTALRSSTYLRGKDLNPEGGREDSAAAVAAWTDSSGNGQAVVVGRSGTNDFPTVGAHQGSSGGYFDGFVAKVSATPPARPYISSLSITRGNSAGGTQVLVAGTSLGEMGGGTRVTFGSTPARVTSITAHGISAVTPPGAGTVDVTVTTAEGTSPQSSFARFMYFDGDWEAQPPPEGSPTRIPRYGHTATVLDNGKVLLVGGQGTIPSSESGQAPLQAATSADVYDPATGAFVSATCGMPGAMACPQGRASAAQAAWAPGHTATMIRGTQAQCRQVCGRVLVVLGSGAQLYDPQTGIWESAAPPQRPRAHHTATLLSGTQAQCGDNCGKILAVGGEVGRDGSLTAELYDPSSNKWSLTGSPVDARQKYFTATLLTGSTCGDNCGKVLVVGGVTYDPQAGTQSSSSAELYDPKTGRWTAPTERRTDLVSRFGHTATRLASGKVLIAGGAIGSAVGNATTAQATASAELYDPSKPLGSAFSIVRDQMLTARVGHAAVALADGRVLVSGGSGVRTGAFQSSARRASLATAEIFDPADGGKWHAVDAMAEKRGAGPWAGGHTLSVVAGEGCGTPCQKVLVFGGASTTQADFGSGMDGAPTASAELFTAGPYISAVSPATGDPAGGEDIVIYGSGFIAERMTDPDSVTFGGVPAQNIRIDSPTRMRVTTPPAGRNTSADVAVVVRELGRAISGFTYAEGDGAVRDLTATALSARDVLLSFTAAGFPPGTEYVIKQSRWPITDADFDSAQSLCEGGVCRFAPKTYQEKLSLPVGGLTPETTYFYALKPIIGAGALGALSNLADVTTAGIAPGAVTDLAATPIGEHEARLTFSSPGSNEADPPPANRFIVKQSLEPIVGAATFDAGRSLCDDGVCKLFSQNVGDPLSLSVKGLERGTTYHYALRAMDDAGNLGPISNSATVAPDCATPSAGPGQLAYPAGYSLVGLPEGTMVPSQSPLYGWFDLGKGGRYSTQDAAQAVAGGRGYWAWFSCPRLVEVSDGGVASTSSPLGRYRASMVGNPSTSSAVISGHDFAARWDPSANGGSGGYQVSGYREAQPLAVGEGAWAFSYRDTTLTVEAR